MSLERRNPLPVGVYQLDVPAKNVRRFIDWRASHKDSVKARKTQEEPAFLWVLFEVLSPVDWDAKLFGFPSTATLQTDRVPGFEPTKDPLDQIADNLPKPGAIAEGFKWMLWGGVALGAFLIYRELSAK